MKQAEDFMTVTLCLEFRARPSGDDALPGVRSYSICLPASDERLPDFLEQIASAVAERCLYGFLQQLAADAAVSSGEIVARPDSDGGNGGIPLNVEKFVR